MNAAWKVKEEQSVEAQGEEMTVPMCPAIFLGLRGAGGGRNFISCSRSSFQS